MKLKTKTMTSKWITIPFGENEEDDPKFKIHPLTERQLAVVKDYVVTDKETGHITFKADGKYRVAKDGTEGWDNIEVDGEPFLFTSNWDRNFEVLPHTIVDFLAINIMLYTEFSEEDEKKLLQRLKSSDPPEISTVENVSGGDIVMS